MVTPPPDGKWGVVDTNGYWNGMIRQVMDKKVRSKIVF